MDLTAGIHNNIDSSIEMGIIVVEAKNNVKFGLKMMTAVVVLKKW